MPSKKKPTSTRGNTYTLTATGKKHLADIGGQGGQIRDLLAKRSITAADIGKSLPKIPKPNIAYYLSVWKADGFVKFGAKPKQ